ncbi:MAG: stage II sporulation protein D [Thermovenabulum sp.]|uniref:stage II sporulation protein D n=1 Tax=Thermovenabulum sp. TaxID=3100335 RepID=UPI003C7D0C96
MKKNDLITIFLVFFMFVIIIGIPALAVKGCGSIEKKEFIDSREKGNEKASREVKINVFINSKSRIEQLPLEEYVKGVVAAEMPANFNIEALKAQAVAARTYAVKRMINFGGSGCALHPGADVCDDPTHCQAYISKTEMIKKWGIFAFYHFYSKINQATLATKGLVILYDGKPIDPLFHSTSGGRTENSEDVWGKYIPYLRSVSSPGEEDSPKFLSVKSIPVSEMVVKFREKWPNIVIDPKNPEKQMEVLERSSGGRIKRIKIGNIEAKGTDIRELFELNSTNFTWVREKDEIRFTTIGYGHGVGMSQYGANYMAKRGCNFIDILKHYYTGVVIQKFYE